MLLLRRYDLAAGLFSEVAAGAPNPAALTNLIEILRKARRLEEIPLTIERPEDTARSLLIRAWMQDQHQQDWMEPLSPLLTEGEKPNQQKAMIRELAGVKGKVRGSGLTAEGALEIGLATVQYAREGDDTTGWVIRLIAPGNGSIATNEQVFFIARENGHYRILAAFGLFQGVARLVLQLAAQGKTESAKIWLDRARQELPAGSGDDPLSGQMFSRFWHQGQTASPEQIRTAAALLLAGEEKGIDRTVEFLEAAAKTADASAADFISASLAEAYFVAKRYEPSLRTAEGLLQRLPQSATALRLTLQAAYAFGGVKEAARVATANLGRFKNDIEGLRSAATTAMLFDDTETSIRIEKQIVDSGRAKDVDYNQVAWAELMAGKVTAATLEIANRGMLMGNNSSTSLMHTLAAVQAEMDKPSEARALLLQRITSLGQDEPDDDDWYVFGRIAECYGLKEEAAAMYRRLEKPQAETGLAASSYALAQKRLKAIDAAK